MAKRIVVVVSDGLVSGIWVSGGLENFKAQVLNVDRDDPIEGARWSAYRLVADAGLEPLDWTFLGTEDSD
jgi:hypothetical protein